MRYFADGFIHLHIIVYLVPIGAELFAPGANTRVAFI